MAERRSLLEIVPYNDGYRMQGLLGVQVDLSVRGDSMGVSNGTCTHLPIIGFRKLCKEVIYRATQQYKPKKKFPRAKQWFMRKYSPLINHVLYKWWETIVSKSDPKVIAIQKRVFSVTGRMEYYLCNKYLLDKYFYEDIMKYTGACYAALFIDEIGGLSSDDHGNSVCEAGRYNCREWLKFFASQDKVYPNLAHTLYKAPRNMPARAVRHFRGIKFERVITNRIELLFTIASYGTPFTHAAQFATKDEIKRASLITGANNHRITQYEGIRELAMYINDAYDNEERDALNRRSLLRIARDAVTWHATHRREQERLWRENGFTAFIPYELTDVAAVPPIELPDYTNIVLLSTYEDFVKESNDMQHCVEAYFSKAKQGTCYIFHVSYKGEAATAEVSADGTVRQVRGPKNSHNGACSYAEQELRKWGRGLKNLQKQGCSS
jgi:hypothetical protein